MTEYTNLAVDVADGVMTVRINRPKVLNALSSEVLRELHGLFSSVSTDDSVGAVVLTGADTGKKPAFAAGADIGEMSEMTGLQMRRHSRLGQGAFDAIERCGRPVIAAVNGFALGGGLELAMACHVRYASTEALVGQPEINLGIIPGFAGTQRLPRLVGKGRALEMMLTGDMVGAEEAHAWGLIDRIFTPEELMDAATSLAGKLASKAPVARSLILDAVARGCDMSFEDAQRIESDLFGVVGATQDVKEGLSAFLEKREAGFKGE